MSGVPWPRGRRSQPALGGPRSHCSVRFSPTMNASGEYCTVPAGWDPWNQSCAGISRIAAVFSNTSKQHYNGACATLHYSVAQCCMVLCGVAQCCTVSESVVQYRKVLCSIVQCCTVLHSVVFYCCTMLHSVAHALHSVAQESPLTAGQQVAKFLYWDRTREFHTEYREWRAKCERSQAQSAQSMRAMEHYAWLHSAMPPQMWDLANEYIEPPDEELYEDPGPQPYFRFSWETVTGDDLMAASSVNRARMFRPTSLVEPAAASQDSQGMGHISASFRFPLRPPDGAHKGRRAPPPAQPTCGMDPSIPGPKAVAPPKERSMSVLPPVRAIESRVGPRSKSHPVLNTGPASPALANRKPVAPTGPPPQKRESRLLLALRSEAKQCWRTHSDAPRPPPPADVVPRTPANAPRGPLPLLLPKTPAAPRRALVCDQESGGARGRNLMPNALPVLV